MLTVRRLALFSLVAALGLLPCRAQTPFVNPVVLGKSLPPEVAHRVEVLLRQKADLPPESTIEISPVVSSDTAGFFTVMVAVSAEGKVSHPITFLISADGKTLAQFTKYDISADPRTMISDEGRPARGGPETAPVIIVVFDDLECPYCARFYASMFPAVTERYGDKVHIVYKDFPLTEIHPWAMRAAVDVNCLATQSSTGYWNAVDYIHANASHIGEDQSPKPAAKDDKDAKDSAKDDKTLPRANEQLDKIVREQAERLKLNMATLDACIAKQDTTTEEASRKLATDLNLQAAPTMFINGNKVDGAVSIGFIFGQIDNALLAENVAPPPPYVAPKPPTPPATPTPAAAPAKPAATPPAK
jgi:protein-disulfide isomerase